MFLDLLGVRGGVCACASFESASKRLGRKRESFPARSATSDASEGTSQFLLASSLGSVCPDDRWVLIDIDPFQKSSIHHANQPEGSNLCKVMLRSVTHLSALLDPRSSYTAHVDQSWRVPLQEVVQIFSAVFSNESDLKWTTKFLVYNLKLSCRASGCSFELLRPCPQAQSAASSCRDAGAADPLRRPCGSLPT